MPICDACEEVWEESFFCEKCSSGGHEEIVEKPNTMWDGDPHDETIFEEEWVSNGNICMNCCRCNLII